MKDAEIEVRKNLVINISTAVEVFIKDLVKILCDKGYPSLVILV